MEKKDNLVDYVEYLDHVQFALILEAVERFDPKANIHAGQVPFLNRVYVLEQLVKLRDELPKHIHFAEHPLIKMISALASRGDLWKEITKVGDRWRSFKNIINGEIKREVIYEEIIADYSASIGPVSVPNAVTKEMLDKWQNETKRRYL